MTTTTSSLSPLTRSFLPVQQDLICSHTPSLRRYYEEADTSMTGSIPVATWAAGLRQIVRGGQALPWEDYAQHLVGVSSDGSISYRTFLQRFRVAPSGPSGAWTARLLSGMYEKLSKLSLSDTVAFFDENGDGLVSFDELKKVVATFALGLPEEAVLSLTRQLLKGQDALRIVDLLDMIDVTYKEEAKDGMCPHRALSLTHTQLPSPQNTAICLSHTAVLCPPLSLHRHAAEIAALMGRASTRSRLQTVCNAPSGQHRFVQGVRL